jgi:hypothetical protein
LVSDGEEVVLVVPRARGWDSVPSGNTDNTATPTGADYQTGGAPAPPRDAREDIGDLPDPLV